MCNISVLDEYYLGICALVTVGQQVMVVYDIQSNSRSERAYSLSKQLHFFAKLPNSLSKQLPFLSRMHTQVAE
jgi:hypothetical protein